MEPQQQRFSAAISGETADCYLGECVSDEGFHYLSPLLSGQSLLQQLLLPHLLHADVGQPPVQTLDEGRTPGLAAEKKHLGRAEGEQGGVQGGRKPTSRSSCSLSPDGVPWSL